MREALGPEIPLRADANGKWTLEQALQFGHAVKGANLEVRAPRSPCGNEPSVNGVVLCWHVCGPEE